MGPWSHDNATFVALSHLCPTATLAAPACDPCLEKLFRDTPLRLRERVPYASRRRLRFLLRGCCMPACRLVVRRRASGSERGPFTRPACSPTIMDRDGTASDASQYEGRSHIVGRDDGSVGPFAVRHAGESDCR